MLATLDTASHDQQVTSTTPSTVPTPFRVPSLPRARSRSAVATVPGPGLVTLHPPSGTALD